MKEYKQLFLCLLTGLVFTLGSCTKIESQPETKVADETPTKTTNSHLSFASIEDLEDTVNLLLKMNKAELKVWYESKKIVSIQQLYDIAIMELDQINDINEIENFKQRYSDYFLFDNNKYEINASPYFKISKFGYSFVCNVNGEVIINGEICNFNDLTTFEETLYYSKPDLSRKSVKRNERDNYASLSYGDRRFTVSAKRVNNTVYIEFLGEKRTMWWKSYATTYDVTFISKNEGGWFTNKVETYSLSPVDINTIGLLRLLDSYSGNYIVTPELGPNAWLYFGTRSKTELMDSFGNVQNIIYPYAEATVNVSSRGTAGHTARLLIKPNSL